MGKSPEASQHILLSRAAGSQHASDIIAVRISRKTLMEGKLAKLIRITHTEAF